MMMVSALMRVRGFSRRFSEVKREFLRVLLVGSSFGPAD